MAFEVRSSWPGMPRGRALFLQGILVAVLATAWFRSAEPIPRAPSVALTSARPTPQAPSTLLDSRVRDSLAAIRPGDARLGGGAHTLAPSTTSPGVIGSSIEVIVSQNDTMDRIFRRLELDIADLATLRSLPELRAKLDRLYPGESLKFVHQDGELLALERQLSASETLKVTRDDAGFESTVLENPLEKRVRTAQGVIRSSLFQATGDAGVGDNIALQLADIFEYDIDFVLEIQSGDRFVVTYEQLWQDGEYLKDGDILAVKFVNSGREYRAVRFVDERGQADYFSPDGRSLRKAFLRAPVAFSRVSSRFNMYRRHPVLNRIRAHKGVDYAAPTGTPVRAAGDARVRFVGRQGGYGNVIELEHSHGVVTVYGHLSRFAKGIKRNQKVAQGQLIGYVGRTGLATGPHLHYEYRVRGVHKDPQTVPLPKADPVPASLMAAFREQTDELNESLDFPVGPLLVAR
jgi:murein DD-endopeptidase MepM/ murein hydrolase activator NlpD